MIRSNILGNEVFENRNDRLSFYDRRNSQHLKDVDSRCGALEQARDVDRAALLPIRGKLINCFKNPIDEVLENEEIKSIIQALGCGIMEHYNSKKLKYGKLVIAVDADADGYAIANLIITMVQTFFPQMITENRLGWLRAPLFRVKTKKDRAYFYSEEELENYMSKNPKGQITRFKG